MNDGVMDFANHFVIQTHDVFLKKIYVNAQAYF